MNTSDLMINFKKAKHIRKIQLYEYSYEYYDKDGEIFELDKFSTTNYGSSSKDFGRWVKRSNELIINKNNDVIVKFCSSAKSLGEIRKIIFIKRLTNEYLLDELKVLFDEIFKQICQILNVIDIDAFRYYILGGEVYAFLTAEDLLERINKLEKVFRLYYIDDNLKRLINKIIR